MPGFLVVGAIGVKTHFGLHFLVNVNDKKLAKPLLYIFNTFLKAALRHFTLTTGLPFLLFDMLLDTFFTNCLGVLPLFIHWIIAAIVHPLGFHDAHSRLKIAFIASLVAQALLKLGTNHVAALKFRILGKNRVKVTQSLAILMGLDKQHSALIQSHKVVLVLIEHLVEAINALLILPGVNKHHSAVIECRIVVGVTLKDKVVILNSLIACSHLRAQQCAVIMSRDIIRVKLNSIIKIFHSAPNVIELITQIGTIDIKCHVAWLKIYCLIDVGQSFRSIF